MAFTLQFEVKFQAQFRTRYLQFYYDTLGGPGEEDKIFIQVVSNNETPNPKDWEYLRQVTHGNELIISRAVKLAEAERYELRKKDEKIKWKLKYDMKNILH